jgi:hypothetical protein
MGRWDPKAGSRESRSAPSRRCPNTKSPIGPRVPPGARSAGSGTVPAATIREDRDGPAPTCSGSSVNARRPEFDLLEGTRGGGPGSAGEGPTDQPPARALVARRPGRSEGSRPRARPRSISWMCSPTAGTSPDRPGSSCTAVNGCGARPVGHRIGSSAPAIPTTTHPSGRLRRTRLANNSSSVFSDTTRHGGPEPTPVAGRLTPRRTHPRLAGGIGRSVYLPRPEWSRGTSTSDRRTARRSDLV